MQRLKTRSQFQAALAGKTVARTAHFALHRLALDPPMLAPAPNATLFPACVPWLGAMVPKRWARRAVTRNTIKRQIYQVSGSMAADFMCAAHVVRLRSTFDRSEFISASSEALKHAVRSELITLFRRAHCPVRDPLPAA